MQPFVRANLGILVRQSCIPIPKAKRRHRRRYHQTVNAAPLDHTFQISSRSIDRDWKIRTCPTTFLSAPLRSALPLLQILDCLSATTLHDLSHQTNVDTPLNAPPRSSVAWAVSPQPKWMIQLKSILLWINLKHIKKLNKAKQIDLIFCPIEDSPPYILFFQTKVVWWYQFYQGILWKITKCCRLYSVHGVFPNKSKTFLDKRWTCSFPT